MQQLFTLNKYFRKYYLYFISGIVFIVLTNYFKILSPQITGYVVNSVTAEASGKAKQIGGVENFNFLVKFIIKIYNSYSFSTKIMVAGLMLLIVAIISGLFMFLMRQTIIVMSRHIEFDQKNEIFNKYQSLDASFFKRNSTGDLMNRISEDVSRVRMYTGPAIMYFINLAAVIGFSLFFMYKADPKLTFLSLLPLPILAFTIYKVNSVVDVKSERIQHMLSKLTSNAQESYSGIRIIKSFVQEKNTLGFFAKNSNEYRANALSLAKTEALYFPSMAFLVGLSTLIVVLVGGLDVARGVEGASLGKIAEFVMYIQMLSFPVSAIGWTASMTQRAIASQRRINEFLLEEPVVKNHQNAIEKKIAGKIEFDNVNFTYPLTGIRAINNLNLKIEPGQKIAVLGKTGSGKSTLANLILRNFDVDSGVLKIDDLNIENYQLENLRSQISYVPQDVFLFSDTIANNIKMGNQNASQEQIENAAKYAAVYNEVLKMSSGFETLIGERGVTLSGGQKQRLSIARALVKDAPIIIFDDCLSAVDAKTEQEITQHFNQVLKEKTAIIITHRIFAQMHFDNIIILDEGKITEQGTHQQLIALNGKYAKMYYHQMQQERQNGL